MNKHTAPWLLKLPRNIFRYIGDYMHLFGASSLALVLLWQMHLAGLPDLALEASALCRLPGSE